MDQSKGTILNEDQQVRMACIQMAQQLSSKANGYPDEAIGIARDFYLFLTGKDPLVDVVMESETDNVILLQPR